MRITQQIPCPSDSRFRVELDSSEIYPDDPGNGTPAMLFGPRGASSTFQCALDTGEMQLLDHYTEIPPSVQQWLESLEDEVEAFLSENAPAATT